jgi:large subunit ribosomal protein L15
MPLVRRVPKRGFTNPFRVASQPVNLRDLAKLPGTEVTPVTLRAAGLVSRADRPVKVLGTGDASRAYAVTGCLISASAKEKIERAGGKVEA